MCSVCKKYFPPGIEGFDMTSRECILAALNHREPDRVPVDLAGHGSSGIAPLAYARLRRALGLKEVTLRIFDPVQQLAVMHDDLLDVLGIDTIQLGQGFALDDKDWVDWRLRDGTLCQMPFWAVPQRGEGEWLLRTPNGLAIGKMPDGGFYFSQCNWPLFDATDDRPLEDAMRECLWTAIPSPPGPFAADMGTFTAGARRLRERTDRAILGVFGGSLFETGQHLYRMDRFLEMLAGEPLRAHAFLDRLLEIHLSRLERFLKAVGPYIDIIVFGDDLGGQNSPLMSPKMFREFFKPRHSQLFRRAKELADVKVMMHCCGAVRPLLRDLIEAGIDAINPVQISCRGMDAAELKREFGRDLTLWGGGCDTQSILPTATPEAVQEHVLRQVSILAPGGGFVFQQVHNIQTDVPPENILAMYDAVKSMQSTETTAQRVR
jgi:uroporphyrinogen decarboxylase